MKALALDTSVTRITIAAKNDDKFASLTLDIGMRQSEKLLPSIDYVLKQTALEAKDLDYTVCTKGPGSFTGLRLGLSALKPLTLAFGTPVYGVSTLQAWLWPFRNFEENVLSVIDAKKEKFYASANNGCRNELLIEEDDYDLNFLAQKLNEPAFKDNKIIVTGPDCSLFIEKIKHLCPDSKLISTGSGSFNIETLFEMAEDMISKKIPALQDFEGPVYIRSSEAQINLEAGKL